MKPRFAICLLIVTGCVLLIAIWVWALLDGVRLPQLILAIMASAILCIGSATLTTKIIRQYPVISVGDFTSSTAVPAILSAIVGTFVLIWECIPGGEGAPTDIYIDRRYAFLFYAISAHLIIFPLLSRRKSQ